MGDAVAKTVPVTDAVAGGVPEGDRDTLGVPEGVRQCEGEGVEETVTVELPLRMLVGVTLGMRVGESVDVSEAVAVGVCVDVCVPERDRLLDTDAEAPTEREGVALRVAEGLPVEDGLDVSVTV